MDASDNQFPRYYSYYNEHNCWDGQLVSSQEEIDEIERDLEKRRKIIRSRLHSLDHNNSLAEQFRLSLSSCSVRFFPQQLYGNLFDHYIVNNNHTYKLEDIRGVQLEDIFCEMVNVPRENKYLHLPLFQKWIKMVMVAKTSFFAQESKKNDDSKKESKIELSDQLQRSGRGKPISDLSSTQINPHYFNSHGHQRHLGYPKYGNHNIYPQFGTPMGYHREIIITSRYGYTIIENIDKGNIIDLSY